MADLNQLRIGTTCQGEPGGASDGVYVGKNGSGAAATVDLYAGITIERVATGIHVVGGAVSAVTLNQSPPFVTSVAVNNVTNGLVLDGGSAFLCLAVANASNAGILCQ